MGKITAARSDKKLDGMMKGVDIKKNINDGVIERRLVQYEVVVKTCVDLIFVHACTHMLYIHTAVCTPRRRRKRRRGRRRRRGKRRVLRIRRKRA